MVPAKSLIAELETAVQCGSVDKRIATMQRITDLFFNSADQLNDEQIGLFDTVLMQIVKLVETKALAELSQRFARVRNAPVGVVQHFARHDDISVAGPVLSKSERLNTSDLIEIAKKKGEPHLLAISDRRQLIEAVTDILLERGSNDVFCRLAQNPGAAFSQTGLESLINRAADDATLAEKIGQRIDIPPHMLSTLVSKATHAVRVKLLGTLPPEFHTEIRNLLDSVAREVTLQIAPKNGDLKGAQEFVSALHRKNQLKEPVLVDLANKGEREKLIAGLALMTSTRLELVDRLMNAAHYGGLIVVCKAAELSWASVQTILKQRLPGRPIGIADLEHAKADYAELNKWAAIRLLGFWQAQSDLKPS